MNRILIFFFCFGRRVFLIYLWSIVKTSSYSFYFYAKKLLCIRNQERSKPYDIRATYSNKNKNPEKKVKLIIIFYLN